ncbi:MAG: hypothetical protein KGH62_05510 [Candidatus Micrarchaeota archaeon]|nr:hypothetical protein [Candidatus Micrarchaeota archaeon]
MDGESSKKLINGLVLGLNGSSVLLVIGSLFLIQIFSVLYGIANGIQINYGTGGVPRQFETFVSQAAYMHEGIFESYVLVVVAIILLETAFMLFLRRTDRTTSGARKYVAMHTAFAVIYGLIFYIIYVNSSQYLNEPYMWAIYLGVALSIILGVALNYIMRMPVDHASALKRTLKVDPARPFSNMLELQEHIFSRLGGHLKVVDKHFNSAALTNFHRLVSDNLKQFSEITIITSTEMVDSNFGRNIADFKKELEANNVGFELRFMDENDKVDQHERMMLDDSVAYKIPPFNIINKRSEHIILIKHEEAQRRFAQLYGRAISFENYSVKKARAPDQDAPAGQ